MFVAAQVWCLAAAVSAGVPRAAHEGMVRPLARAAAARNAAAVAAIRSMECRYERVPAPGTPPEVAARHVRLTAGRFARAGTTFLFEEPFGPSATREYVVRDGKMLERLPPDEFGTRLLFGPVRGDLDGGEMWQYLLFAHTAPPGPPAPLAGLLNRRWTELRAARVLPTGAVYVATGYGADAFEFWLDPRANHLVRRCAWQQPGEPPARWEHEVLAFAEPAPGVFVPVEVETRLLHGGAPVAAVRTHVTDLKVNHEVPADALRIPGIAGANCYNYERNVEYVVDADGNPAGPERAPRTPPPAAAALPEWAWGPVAGGAFLAACYALGLLNMGGRGRRRTSP